MRKSLWLLPLVLLMAMSVHAQKLSEPTWRPNGTYTCAIGKICRTPTQKEIDKHNFTQTQLTTFDPGPCASSFQYDAKTDTCSIRIDFTTPNNEPMNCSPLEAVDFPNFAQEIICFYTPKKAKP